MNKTLSPEQVTGLLSERIGWSLAGGMLVRSWTFPSFAQAIAFVQRIAALAEQADHHPDIDIRYNRVKLALISHDVDGLSSRDAAMVRAIDESFPD